MTNSLNHNHMSDEESEYTPMYPVEQVFHPQFTCALKKMDVLNGDLFALYKDGTLRDAALHLSMGAPFDGPLGSPHVYQRDMGDVRCIIVVTDIIKRTDTGVEFRWTTY